MSHTEIVNYSFVLRRVGVIWKERDGAGRGEWIAAAWMEKEDGIEGNGREQRICTRANGRERERERDAGVRDVTAGERTRRCISCFVGPLRPMLVTEVGWAVVWWPVRARGKTKNEDEVNDIHAGYRILPSRARPRLPSFRLPFFFSPSRPISRALRLSLSPLEFSHGHPHDFSYFT